MACSELLPINEHIHAESLLSLIILSFPAIACALHLIVHCSYLPIETGAMQLGGDQLLWSAVNYVEIMQ